MTFTPNQNLEQQPAGNADWDTGLNANISIIDRGYHSERVTGSAINTGDALWLTGSGTVVPYDATSIDLRAAFALSHQVVSSGEQGFFIRYGRINSIDIWSGNISPGEPIYISPTTPGFLVSSYPGADHPVGIALEHMGVLFDPSFPRPIPEAITATQSLALIVGSAHDFSLDLGHRGITRKLRTLTDSLDAYKIRFWSGSTRANSELLYETITTSVDGGASDFDVQSLDFINRSPFGYINTDIGSPALIFGRIDAQSSANVGSSDMVVQLIGERLR